MRHPVFFWHSFVWMLFLTDLFRVNFSVSIWWKTNRHLRLDFAHYCLCDRNVLRIDRRNLQLSSRAICSPCCVRRRRAWHRVWPPHQTSHSMSGGFETIGMIFWNNSFSELPEHVDWRYPMVVTQNFSKKRYFAWKMRYNIAALLLSLAINANLIYTLHTLCIEEYNKK